MEMEIVSTASEYLAGLGLDAAKEHFKENLDEQKLKSALQSYRLIKEKLEALDTPISMLSYVATNSVNLFGASFEFQIMRTFKCAKMQDAERIKKIVELSQEGFGASKEAAAEKLQKELSLGAEEAEDYVKKSW